MNKEFGDFDSEKEMNAYNDGMQFGMAFIGGFVIVTLLAIIIILILTNHHI